MSQAGLHAGCDLRGIFQKCCFDCVCAHLPLEWDVAARMLVMFKSHVINCPLASNVLRFNAIVASHSMPWPEQVLKLRYETWFSLMSKVCQFPLAGMLGPGQPSSFSSPQFVKIATSALHWLPVSLVDQTMPQHRPPSGAKLASINIMQWDVAAGSVLKAFAIMLSSWQIVMVVIVSCAFNECVWQGWL